MRILPDRKISNKILILKAAIKFITISILSMFLYVSVFYVHLQILRKAGPHDSVMTSAFQASLEVSVDFSSIKKPSGKNLKIFIGFSNFLSDPI